MIVARGLAVVLMMAPAMAASAQGVGKGPVPGAPYATPAPYAPASSEIGRPLPPPALADGTRLVPFNAQQRAGWLGECRQRLAVGSAPDWALIDQSCESWLRYFEAGGRGDNGAYAIPVAITTTTQDCCTPCPPRKPRRPHRVLRDKRVRMDFKD